MNIRPLAERLLSRVEMIPEAGCWVYTGSINRRGYAYIGTGKHQKAMLAHRASYECFVNQVPTGLHVLHRCDVPSCINPAHLFVGTHADNMRDKIAKGRENYRPLTGEAHPNAKITELVARDILTSKANGESPRSIACRLGLPVRYIYNVVCVPTRWSHLKRALAA